MPPGVFFRVGHKLWFYYALARPQSAFVLQLGESGTRGVNTHTGFITFVRCAPVAVGTVCVSCAVINESGPRRHSVR